MKMNMNPNSKPTTRRGTAVVIIVLLMAMLGLVVAGSIRPLRDEADIASLRVETTRAFYASESGGIIVMNAFMGNTDMPDPGSSITLNNETIHFLQQPDSDGVTIIEGVSGDARRVIQLTIR